MLRFRRAGVLRLIDGAQLSAQELRLQGSQARLTRESRINLVRGNNSPPEAVKPEAVPSVTSMKDLMENRLASMVDRPWARQLWAMNPAFSSARQIASSPSFQFQLGMFSR